MNFKTIIPVFAALALLAPSAQASCYGDMMCEANRQRNFEAQRLRQENDRQIEMQREMRRQIRNSQQSSYY